ncbi:hypothetical protein Mp_4g21890 [Marchantia polymorpha subsp. ruderalis]|uniref:Uncharacterized protein n=2 Tax=Marchantia polymorpha TaxID=3197 RepID=A0AAF6BCF8_MARPO|nr:hypothetical protein MARPO_0090s0033 [Marchantia polymorpha]BBN09692.1 hypothetical protein Mp_4g21890 [Marchantia polymorpha subsp. ruderalis]|eukprot:PTQ33293.1 hypothetical protein MARPO_0090s0033 [Marchantia polymorpha]
MILPRLAKGLQSGSVSRAFSSISNALNFSRSGCAIPSAEALSEAQICGRGDSRTKKGKRFKGSNGNCRHQKGWETRRLREKWEIPAGPAPGSLLPRPFPPLLSSRRLVMKSSNSHMSVHFVQWMGDHE